MARIVIVTLLTSMVILCFIWWPSMQMEKPSDNKLNKSIELKDVWSGTRDTITWCIGTVNGVMLIVAAFKGRRGRKRKR